MHQVCWGTRNFNHLPVLGYEVCFEQAIQMNQSDENVDVPSHLVSRLTLLQTVSETM